jgi:hypothetical protein
MSFPKKHRNPLLPLYKKNQGFQNQLDKNPLCEHSIIKSKCSPSAHTNSPKAQPIKETLIHAFSSISPDSKEYSHNPSVLIFLWQPHT